MFSFMHITLKCIYLSNIHLRYMETASIDFKMQIDISYYLGRYRRLKSKYLLFTEWYSNVVFKYR